jgi:hypothetical protein
MRWREIIKESGDSSSAPGGDTGKKHSLNKRHQAVMPGATRYPDTPAHYYNMYRFGVHMAGSPDEQNYNPAGPSGNEMITMGYSDADHDIINNSAKAMGFKGKQMTGHGSYEPDDTHKVSPVAKWN